MVVLGAVWAVLKRRENRKGENAKILQTPGTNHGFLPLGALLGGLLGRFGGLLGRLRVVLSISRRSFGDSGSYLTVFGAS
eukprot:968376-Pyramimonas_sp.AAC.1